MDFNYKYKMATMAPTCGIIEVPSAELPDLCLIPTTVLNEAFDEPSPEPRGRKEIKKVRKIKMARRPNKGSFSVNLVNACGQPSPVARWRGTKRKLGMDDIIKEEMDLSAATKENEEIIAEEAHLKEKLQEMRKTLIDYIDQGKLRLTDCPDRQSCPSTAATTMDLDSLARKEFKCDFVETWDLGDLAKLNLIPLSCENNVPGPKDLSDWRNLYDY